MPRLVRGAFAERVRAAVAGQPVDTLGGGAFDKVQLSAWEVRQFEAVLAAGRAPNDWRYWANTLAFVDASLHGASLGSVDEGFYNRVRAFVAKTQAPDGAKAAVEFLHALGTLDHARAAQQSVLLEQEQRAGRPWVDPAVLRTAGVVVRLKAGDEAGAERLFDLLAGAEANTDARMLLLKAYLRAAR
jgi:hypothetical protein